MGTVDRVIRRRIILGVLLVIAFGMLSVWYRESDSGPLHRAQARVADLALPLEQATQRIAQPFRDAGAWVRGISAQEAENRRLRDQVRMQEAEIASLSAQGAETARLRAMLAARPHPSSIGGLVPRYAEVRARLGEFDGGRLRVDAGTAQGVGKCDPVVAATSDPKSGKLESALIGNVTQVTRESAIVSLLTSPDFRVSVTVRGVQGLLGPSGGDANSLAIDNIFLQDRVEAGDVVTTDGWDDTTARGLRSCYPPGLPVAIVSSVGQSTDDLHKELQAQPIAALGRVDRVYVLTGRAK